MPVGPGAGRQWQGASIDFVLTKSIRDSAAMLDLLQTVQPAAAFHTPLFPGKYSEEMKKDFQRPLRIAFSIDSPVGTPVSADARQAVMKTAKWLEQQGHHVEEKGNGIDGIGLMRDYYLMNSGEMALLVRNLEKGAGRKLTAGDMEIESWLLSRHRRSLFPTAEQSFARFPAMRQFADFRRRKGRGRSQIEIIAFMQHGHLRCSRIP